MAHLAKSWLWSAQTYMEDFVEAQVTPEGSHFSMESVPQSTTHQVENCCVECFNQSFMPQVPHALRDCPKAREVLTYGEVDGRILRSEWSTGVDWIESIMRLLDKPTFECFVMVLWNI